MLVGMDESRTNKGVYYNFLFSKKDDVFNFKMSVARRGKKS